MGLLEQWKGVRYRARIFDHGLHIRTLEVPDRGQRKIEITVKGKTLGILGEETRLAFMINPKIPPKIFGGFVQEIDFDIRDAVQLSDLLDIAPDLVYGINENYRAIQEMRESPDIEKILEPAPAPVIEPVQPTGEPTEAGGAENPEEEKKPLPPLPSKPKKPGLIKTGKKLTDTLMALRDAQFDAEKNRLIKECLELCVEYPKLLYWLPRYLKIEPEIHAICSQSKVKQNGVIPSYYIEQSKAMISEKVLARPAVKQGWQEVILILGCLVVFVILAIVVFRALGMI
jgi:hypothetical protein